LPSLRPILKKGYTHLAILVGFLLLYVEVRRLRTHSVWEEWFWLLVAVFIIALGLAELLFKTPKK
jgi:hypothetical protein